jgi:MFS family permease
MQEDLHISTVALGWATGAVSNYYLLLLIRFSFGMGDAGAYPNAPVVIARCFPAHQPWAGAQTSTAESPAILSCEDSG